uniref:neuronal-specific septin-3 isoform X3 n=1 Tax=Jaculus jaculus TaxID=51337 RepID=UPI001E1B4605|nr:neuronal-specific septin-3 isoform X3 [Jaculus jaculus]
MDHSFASAPPQMQPHRAPAPRSPFSRGHMPGPHAYSSRLPAGVSSLMPVLKKTVHLDAFSHSPVLQAVSQPGLRARTRSMPPQEAAIAPRVAISPLPANSLMPRKLSSISLTIRQSIQARTVDPAHSHCAKLPVLGKEPPVHAGRQSSPSSPPMALVPEPGASSEHPGNPGLLKSGKRPTGEKPLVSSYLALPFQPRLTQSSPSLARPDTVGQGPNRSSPGRGRLWSRGIPRPRGCLQRASPVMNLSAVGTKPDIARNLGTMATSRPGLSVNTAAPNTCRLVTGKAFPDLDAKLGTDMGLPTSTKSAKSMNLAVPGTLEPSTDMNLTRAELIKPGKGTDLAFTDPHKPGEVTVTAGITTAELTAGSTAKVLVTPGPVRLSTTRSDTTTALVGVNTAESGTTADSPARNTSRLNITGDSVVIVFPDPATSDTKLDSASYPATSEISTYPLRPSRSTDPAQDWAATGSVTDRAIEPAMLDLAGESKDKCKSLFGGLPETRTDAAMSELVPEPRPKPAVPMKPVSINSSLLGYIGIDTIIEQMRRKTMKTGFDFNIMVVGQSGLGKSTLVNTLFKSQVSRKSSSWNREEKIPKTVEIKAIGHVIEEGGVKMKLTVIDTPGFGDQINNENCWEPIEKYVNEQYEKFLKEEVNISRKKRIPDTRVHCCLYFVSPTGHSLRPLDLEFMKHLSKVVNIIPVIAKADTMTLEEKSEFKQRVRKELEVNGIEFYPQKEFDEDLEDKTENDKIRQESMPFAVVGSDKEYQVNGKRVLGRKTPWGIIEVENLNHCEFALLRDFVIRTHLQDLKEVTHNIHYETYRAKRLNDSGGLPPGEGLLGTALPPVPATPCPTAE